MATTVDELITIYKAVDQHTAVAKGIAQAQMQMGKGIVDTTRAREAGQRILTQETRLLQQELKLEQQVARTKRDEANERAANTRAMSAEVRLHEQLTRAQERQEKSTRALGAARRFANGFGSTRLNFGAASPLISSFTRGGVAGGLGALAATGIGAGISGLGALRNAAMSGAGSLLGGAGQGIMSIGGMAEEASISASSRQARLTAILRNAQTAAQVLKQAEAVAAPSTATTKQLADAATTLEAFGVNAMRTLPIIGKLATAMGAGEEQMQMYSRAVGQLGTGNMIDADVMASMGLQRRDFAQQGIKFDGNGKLLSSAEESLKALERIVNDRFGNIFEQMANTPEAKRASLEDAGQRALRIIGDGMLKTQGPLVDALTKNLNAAVDSGVLAEVVGKISGEIFSAFNLGGQGDAVTGIMARVLAFVEVVPGNLARGLAFIKDFTLAAIGNVSEFFKMAEDQASRFMAKLSIMVSQGAMLSQGIQRALENPFAATSILGSTFAEMNTMGSAAEMAMSASPSYAPQYKALPGLPQMNSIDAGRVGEIEARLRKSMMTPSAGIADASGQGFLRRAQMPEAEKAVAEKLGKIADNTEKTAKNTEANVAEAIFGGGSRARKGFSFADVMGGNAGRSGGYTIRTDQAATTLQMALLEVLQENLPDIFADYQRRAGVLS
jgi:hypothetical protein